MAPGGAPLARVRSALPELSGTMRACAEFVVAHAWEVRRLTIHELASRVGTSAPAVIRFVRRLGYTGYRDFSQALALELGRVVGAAYVIPEPLARQLQSPQGGVSPESPVGVISRVFALEMAALQDTWRTLDAQAIERAVSALARAERVLFVATGTGVPLADLAVYRLHILGLSAACAADQAMVVSQIHLLRPGDVLVGLSFHGEAAGVIEALDLARERELTTICLTAVPGSQAAQRAGISLVVCSQDEALGFGQFASRATMLIVLDALAAAVAWARRDTALPHASDVLRDTMRLNAARRVPATRRRKS